MDLTRDFQSLSYFRRNSAAFAKQLRQSNRPLVLTHKGKPDLVVQSAIAYQRLLDLAAKQSAAEGIRQGVEELKKHKGRAAREFFAEFEASRAIPR